MEDIGFLVVDQHQYECVFGINYRIHLETDV